MSWWVGVGRWVSICSPHMRWRAVHHVPLVALCHCRRAGIPWCEIDCTGSRRRFRTARARLRADGVIVRRSAWQGEDGMKTITYSRAAAKAAVAGLRQKKGAKRAWGLAASAAKAASRQQRRSLDGSLRERTFEQMAEDRFRVKAANLPDGCELLVPELDFTNKLNPIEFHEKPSVCVKSKAKVGRLPHTTAHRALLSYNGSMRAGSEGSCHTFRPTAWAWRRVHHPTPIHPSIHTSARPCIRRGERRWSITLTHA